MPLWPAFFGVEAVTCTLIAQTKDILIDNAHTERAKQAKPKKFLQCKRLQFGKGMDRHDAGQSEPQAAMYCAMTNDKFNGSA